MASGRMREMAKTQIDATEKTMYCINGSSFSAVQRPKTQHKKVK